MSEALRQQVREQAARRCEYCRLSETDLPLWPFHLDHIVAEQHFGSATTPENLAWACQRCNLHKGTNLSAVDPDSTNVVRLFNPRSDQWADHFRLADARIEGRTTVGRATAWLLQMNSDERVELRAALQVFGDWPPRQ
jgi:5-methylcytosine-specific restriction endonuclease McrA